MRHEAVPDGKRKQVFLSAITLRYKALIEEVTMDEDSTYQQAERQEEIQVSADDTQNRMR